MWLNDWGEAASLNFFPSKPDIPVAIQHNFITHLRKAYRGYAKNAGCGIVSVEIESIAGIPSLEVVLKKSLNPRGFAFLGSLTIPLHDFSYMIRFEAMERGTTGYREAVVMMIEQPIPQVDKQTGKILGWIQDPYDSAYDADAWYNPADQIKYDQEFDSHPLTRVRQHLKKLKQTIEVDPFVSASPVHTGL